ncbi:copper oxidase [Maritimibacter sp. 55A14]|uniref:cupredoxin domain-containing protein n=1 Tax=Maritimibacter sp. 55A14 TaxID=2174844 RepID=UPI000D6183D7|nr:cupredoxin family protein [Maritimibacter sp. 55A14]PWE32874.1 copper oxidase [Maritimibacter sp. 55A14]
MKLPSLTAALVLFASAASAAGSGDHGHEEHKKEMAIGQPGERANVDRTVEIRMVESDGSMGFEPDSLKVEEGETIRFKIRNLGALEHEVVFDTRENNLEHMSEMARAPEMDHDDPNALRLAPGESGEIVWHFDGEGDFQFACLIPGHMEAGMRGPITVN